MISSLTQVEYETLLYYIQIMHMELVYKLVRYYNLCISPEHPPPQKKTHAERGNILMSPLTSLRSVQCHGHVITYERLYAIYGGHLTLHYKSGSIYQRRGMNMSYCPRIVYDD